MHVFFPTEIIFCPTSKCNLNCSHCLTKKANDCLDVEDAKRFLKSCIDIKNKNGECIIEKIGFSGGEPFLNLDFVCEISKFAVENDFLFDQIITNGVFWKNENELEKSLNRLYDSKYDGKIAVSFDHFHKNGGCDNYFEKIECFVKKVHNIFGENSLVIQSVENKLEMPADFKSIPRYITHQAFLKDNENAWKSKKWFKDDFCTSLGNILFIHANGKIAPCCGFANENDALIIGNIKQTFSEILMQAKNNKMIKACFEEGLLKYAKRKNILKKLKTAHKITFEQCTLCDYICKNL